MDSDNLRTVTEIAILKRDGGWFVALPDKTELGPYHGATFALQIVAVQLLLARRRNQDARFIVQDESGVRHPCALLNQQDTSCNARESHSADCSSCPLRAEIA